MGSCGTKFSQKDVLISFFLENTFLLAFLQRYAVFLNELDFSRKKRRWTELREEVSWSSCSTMEVAQKSYADLQPFNK